MKSLKGHPNVVSLLAHTILDMGQTKEAFLVMEFCEKSLVTLRRSRSLRFSEMYAMQFLPCTASPHPLLIGADGSWKLCDFGSISTNHKRFERPEEMGIEEDNIRKYTTHRL
ncbi:hypothetical protein Scep_002190 [Stephania cephalantha]|uniref:non-specific serine/threonine protein kinase n=1 Tax=Stephania cephalantha TaxID=152367 RepID=A0AAP0LDB8_9MAGN